MSIELTPQERDDAMYSLKKFFSTELDEELTDLRAKMLLDYFLKEIGPLSYNRGANDAEKFFRKHLEDLSATCFEPPFAYWQSRKKK